MAQIKVIYPKSLNSEQEELLNKLHKSFGGEGEPHTSLVDELVEKVKGWFK